MTGRRTAGSLTAVCWMSFVLLAAVEPVQGSTRSGEGRGYFMLGYTKMDLGELNERLEHNGYYDFPDELFSFGGGGHAIMNRLVLGGEGHGFVARETSSAGRRNSLGCGYGFFDLGYIVYSAGGLDVYPLLGLGAGAISLKIVESGTPSFDDVLDDPGRSAELSTGGFLVNVAIGSDYLWRLGAGKKGDGGLVFGFRAGYTFSPIAGDWQLEGNTLPDGPDLSITGPYIHLTIGGGGS